MLALLLGLAVADQPPASAAEADPVVCVRPRAGSEVGTHMRPKKVCLKKSEWDIIDKHTKETLQSINDRGNNPGRADGHAPTPR